MTSIRSRLRAGLAICTLLAFAIAGFATGQAVRRILIDDLDRSLRERARWLMSTVELTADSLELGFNEFELHEFDAGPGASVLELWDADGGALFRSPSLGAFDMGRPEGPIGRDSRVFETLPDGRHLRTYRIRFPSRIDPELEHPPSPPIVALAFARDLSDVDALVRRLHVVFALVALAASALTLLLLRWVVHRSLAPLDLVGTRIAALGAEDLGSRVARDGLATELEPIVDRLNELLERLRAAFERERMLTADMAHELRTPLAGLRTTIELELARPREAHRYQQALETSLAIALRMQDMVASLLQLARLDRGQDSLASESTDLDAVVRGQLDSLDPLAKERRVSVLRHGETGIIIHTDRALLTTAIRNLIENAFAHGDEGGRVEITLARTPAGARLDVANTGATVAQVDVPALFERFARGDASRDAAHGHHGLGLALVRRVCEALGATLHITSSVGGMFVVTLELPHELTPRGAGAPAAPRSQ